MLAKTISEDWPEVPYRYRDGDGSSVALAKGKPTIELKNVDDLVPALGQIHQAVADGELDTVLMAAKKDRAKRFVRSNT